MIVYIEKDMTSLNWIMPFIANNLLVEFTERDFDIYKPFSVGCNLIRVESDDDTFVI